MTAVVCIFCPLLVVHYVYSHATGEQHIAWALPCSAAPQPTTLKHHASGVVQWRLGKPGLKTTVIGRLQITQQLHLCVHSVVVVIS